MNDRLNELRTLAREAQTYQLEREWPDSKLCNQIAQLGSTKTYKRILDDSDPLDELNVENQIKNYRAAVDYISVLRTKDKAPEPEYEDFANVTESLSAVAAAIQEDSISRFVVIQGENGTGKDAVKNALLRRWPNITVEVEATELWRESQAVVLADILNALNVRRQKDEQGNKFVMPQTPHGRLELIYHELNKRKLILLINEGHHMGPRALNLLKTLINRSPCVPVMLCIPRLLQRLVNSAYEESIQLFGNRLCQRVCLPSPPADEILLLMERRGVTFTDVSTANAAAKQTASDARHTGNWSYVRMLTRELRKVSQGKPVTLPQYSTAASTTKSKRLLNQNQNH